MAVNPPLVYVVVLHWRNYDRTRNAIASLRNISYANYRVLVVDNGSANGSIEKLQKEFSTCDFLLNEANLGFSRGCNRGIKTAISAGARYVLLLNNDMEVENNFL